LMIYGRPSTNNCQSPVSYCTRRTRPLPLRFLMLNKSPEGLGFNLSKTDTLTNLPGLVATISLAISLS